MQRSPRLEQVHGAGGVRKGAHGSTPNHAMSTPFPVHAQAQLCRSLCAVLPCPLVVLEVDSELAKVSSLFLLRPFGLPQLAPVSAYSAEPSTHHDYAHPSSVLPHERVRTPMAPQCRPFRAPSLTTPCAPGSRSPRAELRTASLPGCHTSSSHCAAAACPRHCPRKHLPSHAFPR